MRIVSLAPSNTEILYKLGVEDQVVATTSLCNYPEGVSEKPSIGGWTNPEVDRINDLDPDLIIASDDLQDDAVNRLEEEGYNVLQVKPHTLEDVYESFWQIGEAVGKTEEAEKLVEEMKEELSKVSFEGSPRIYCEEWMDPPMVSGNWMPDLIRKCNGEYFIEEGRSREFDLEELKEFDPEVIILNVCGAGSNLDPSIIDRRDSWQDISAVKNGNVFVVNDSLLNRPSFRLVEGMRKIEGEV
ncbi:MAG: cobalamin-binding protein [Nanohaloarchaea archaeon]|nr:cobalamin-binding protein [Candidatus Nanohaloarchaea archaeon]